VAECLRNLQRLVLPQGRDWAYTSLETCRSLSLQSPHLQDLTITSTQVSDAWSHTIFPQLTTLHIVWNRRPFGASPTSDPFTGEHYDSRVSRFLEAHPTLKSLTYLPISHSFTLSQGSLPNLEEVWSTHGFVFFLLDSNPKLRVTRRWKTFSQLMLGFRTMQNLGQLAATVEHQSLKELRIFKYDDVQFLRRTAALFPSIEVLDITQFGLSQRFGPVSASFSLYAPPAHDLSQRQSALRSLHFSRTFAILWIPSFGCSSSLGLPRKWQLTRPTWQHDVQSWRRYEQERASPPFQRWKSSCSSPDTMMEL